jgi:rRNA maturation RNase YbeY
MKTKDSPCLNQDSPSLNLLKKYSQVNFSVSLVRDAQMQELNAKYKDRDYITDVLSFETREELEDGVFQLGEVAVNVDQAKRQATEYGNDLEHEIAELVEHGALHLLGVHHDGDK